MDIETTSNTATMKSELTNRWEDIPWRVFRQAVWSLQRRVHDAELRGDKNTVRKVQQRIVDSFCAKALAVQQVAQKNKGRVTAGPDGMANLTSSQMMRMAESLSISRRPSPVRRKLIDKPGKAEKRPLGIPNMCDRAQQALIVLALEPQWEARFSPRQYGFRRGRGTQDAIGFLQRHLRGTGPEWVLDADVEKFFDRLNHNELLSRLDASPQITDAVRKILKAGVLELGEFTPSEQGTPQGGPLSPLLANIALSGLENHLLTEFARHYNGSIGRLGRPAIAIYADDLVILHRDRDVIEWTRQCVESYLSPLGLNLSEQKTRIVHTLEKGGSATRAGFDFLGFYLQHGWRRGRGGVHRPFLLATPSPDAISRFYRDCVARIDKVTLSRKHRGARQARQAKGRPDPVTVMIADLNRKIRGWVAYFCRCNAKEVFSDIDHLLHRKLWIWAKRRFSRKTVEWIKSHLFGGIATDREGSPLKRQDGALRETEWTFKSPFVSAEEEHLTLIKLAHTSIKRQILVRPEKPFYDGDWPYWQNRMSHRYPGTPSMLRVAALRRQKGQCLQCGCRLLKGETLTQRVGEKAKMEIIHAYCSKSPHQTVSETPSLLGGFIGEPV